MYNYNNKIKEEDIEFIETELEINNKKIQKYLINLIKTNRLIEIKQYLNKEKYNKLIDFFKIKKKENKKIFPLRIIEKIIIDDVFIGKLIKNLCEIKIKPLNIKRLNNKEIFKYKYNKKYECFNLPVIKKINLIKELLINNQIIIIEGNTGCGKSTQIPKYLLNYYNKIIVSQPRKIAAISLAERISNECKTIIGEEIGYQVRFQTNKNKETRLLFITDGMLLTKMESFYNNPPSIIIIDEVHERTLSTDIFLAFSKNLLKYNKNIKLILMSATMNINKFIEYFNNCPLIKINEKLYENKIIYLKNKTEDYLISIELIIKKILNSTPTSILIFLPGIEDINKLFYRLKELINKNIKIFKFHSKISLKNQEEIFNEIFINKIILATNLAETSLTIKNLKYVIDSGYVKQNIFNYEKQINCLIKNKISKSQANQRSGRVGRTSNGIVYRIYTIEEFNNFEMNNKPEIFTQNLNELLLNILRYKICISDFIDLNFNKLIKSTKILFYLNFINKNGLTELINLPNFLRSEYSLIILNAFKLGVIEDAIKIVVILTIENNLNFDSIIEKDDFRACISIFNLKQKKEYKKFYNQIFNFFSNLNINNINNQLNKEEEEYNKLDIAITSGLFLNSAIKKDGKYYNCINNSEVVIPPSSILYKNIKDYDLFNKVLIYDNIMFTKREYITRGIFINYKIINKFSKGRFIIVG